MSDCLPYQDIPYFNKLIVDYLNKKEDTANFYHRFPEIEAFDDQMKEKRLTFPTENRKILVEELLHQYGKFPLSEETHKNIRSLSDIDTFTITTGHQLNIFTGPIYFIYKIVTCIKLCHQLKLRYPDKQFVPVYWMATEDHDLEEIQFFNWNTEKKVWKTNQTGAVGRMKAEGFEDLFASFDNELGIGDKANDLRKLFQKAYLFHDNLADATRYLVNELFKDYGLVIIDGDSKALKQVFVPQMKNELLQHQSYKKVTNTIEALQSFDYPVQVNPREINLFYLNNSQRSRIVKKESTYKVLDTSLKFSESELLDELHNNPERFSPNVMLRPLYQEMILPNLAYVGGAGELTYWFQLKSYFESEDVAFPMLILRNAALLKTKKQTKKLANLNLSWKDIFQGKLYVENKIVKQKSSIAIDFSPQKDFLSNQFKELYELAKQTDASFVGAVAAQEKKQKNGLENLEKRLLKAQKKKLSEAIQLANNLREEIFPKGTLQERYINFGEAYLAMQKPFILSLLERFEPLNFVFDLIDLD